MTDERMPDGVRRSLIDSAGRLDRCRVQLNLVRLNMPVEMERARRALGNAVQECATALVEIDAVLDSGDR